MASNIETRQPAPDRLRPEAGAKRTAALAHPRRQAVLDFLRSSPGASFRGISEATQIPHGSLRHHVTKLLRAGVVVEERVSGNLLAHFPAELSRAERLDALVDAFGLRPEYDAVRRLAPVRQGDVLAAVGGPTSTAQHRLGRLVRFGLVTATAVGREVHYDLPAGTPAPRCPTCGRR